MLSEDTYTRGVSGLPAIAPCPDGLYDNGLVCLSVDDIYEKGCCCTMFGCCDNCDEGYTDDGCICMKTGVDIQVTLDDRLSCQDDEDLCDLACFTKCEPGYYAIGCSECAKEP